MQDVRLSNLETLLAAGFSLFPVRANDKRPRDKGWAERDYMPDELREWVRAGGNIGIRLRYTELVLDWDPRNDLLGESLEKFAADAGLDLATCPTVRTPSGGLHSFVRLPDGVVVRIRKKDYPGLDLKGYGGYVLGIGSIHPNHPEGPLYQLEHGDFASVPTLPQQGVERFGARERVKTAGSDEMSIPYLKLLLPHIDADEYGQWIEIGMAISAITGGSDEGLEIWTEWSRSSPRPDTDEACAAHWASFDPSRSDGVGAGTIRFRAEEAGFDLPPDTASLEGMFDEPPPRFEDVPPPPPNPEAPEDEHIPYSRVKRGPDRGKPENTLGNALLGVASLRLGLAHDLWADEIHALGNLTWIRSRYPGFSKEWTDHSIAAVREILLSRDRIAFSKDHIQDAAMTIAGRSAFNPLADWLRGLVWDGEARLDDWLMTYAGVERSAYSIAVGRKILMAAVARVLEPGTKFDCMLVLEGGQGVGKSRLVKAIGGEYANTGFASHDLRSKDAVDAIRTTWVIEMDEMAVLRRNDVEVLKSFLSRTEDKVRLAYRRNVEKFLRRGILIGTTNEDEYLQDATGNRRFWPVKVNPVVNGKWVDVEGFLRARDQIFAEAVAAWLANPKSDALILEGMADEQAREEQEARYDQDAWEDILRAALSDTTDEKGFGFAPTVTIGELLQHVLFVDPADQNGNLRKRVGTVLKRFGWSKAAKREGNRKIRVWRRPDAT